MFAGLEEFVPGLQLYPEHTQLSLDIHGVKPATAPGEVRILEAALFEDMCALFNRAWDLAPAASADGAAKPLRKECAASRRATVLAAFYTIEAYLNSLAFDYLMHADREPSADMDMITEWDHKRERPKLVGFRDKLLQYPRIITGARQPPLQESNCSPLRELLDVSKALRDSVVHASPRPDPFGTHSSKELRFWRLGSTTPITFQSASGEMQPETADPTRLVTSTVDNAIALIRTIEHTVHGHVKRLFWVHDRADDGRFPLSVFE